MYVYCTVVSKRTGRVNVCILLTGRYLGAGTCWHGWE